MDFELGVNMESSIYLYILIFISGTALGWFFGLVTIFIVEVIVRNLFGE